MTDQIEKLARDHQFTILALTAVGTLLAVATSIFIAWLGARSNRTQLRAAVFFSRVIQPGVPNENPPRYLSVNVTNTGVLPLSLEFDFFNWRVPFAGEYASVVPLDAYPEGAIIPNVGRVAQVIYPVEIAPRSSKRFRMSDVATFQGNALEMRARLKWFGGLRLSRVSAVAITSDKKRFRVSMSPEIRREFFAAARTAAPRPAWRG